MKIGSIVKCINSSGIDCKYINKPKLGKLYTVVGFYDGHRGLGLFIEECSDNIFCVFPDGSKIKMPSPFLANRFEEVLEPISIENILEKELTNTPNQKHV